MNNIIFIVSFIHDSFCTCDLRSFPIICSNLVQYKEMKQFFADFPGLKEKQDALYLCQVKIFKKLSRQLVMYQESLIL